MKYLSWKKLIGIIALVIIASADLAGIINIAENTREVFGPIINPISKVSLILIASAVLMSILFPAIELVMNTLLQGTSLTNSLYMRTKYIYMCNVFNFPPRDELIALSSFVRDSVIDSFSSRWISYTILHIFSLVIAATSLYLVPQLEVASWSLMRELEGMHISLVSIAFVIVIFMLNFANDNFTDGSFRSYLGIEIILIRTTVAGLGGSLYVFIFSLFFPQTDLLLRGLSIWMIVFMVMSALAIVILLERTFWKTIEKTPLEVQNKEANRSIYRIIRKHTQLRIATQHLMDNSHLISRKVAEDSVAQGTIKVENTNLTVGDYVADIHLRKWREALNLTQDIGKKRYHLRPVVNIGARIESPNQEIAEILDDISQEEKQQLAADLETAIATLEYNPWSEFRERNQSIAPFYDFTTTLQSKCKDAIDKGDKESLRRYLRLYRGIVEEFSVQSVVQTPEHIHLKVEAEYIVNSLHRIWKYSVENSNNSYPQREMTEEIVDSIYLTIIENRRDGHNAYYSQEFYNLLKHLKSSSGEYDESVQSRIEEIEKICIEEEEYFS